jgi:DNA-binding FadR family transcriptional regulator
MEVQFKKPKMRRISQEVVDQIQQAILDGRLKPGGLLPSEMKLKDLFGTSRGTIREALRVLEQKGLIDIKVGVSGGAVVKPVDTRNITESLNLLIQYQHVSIDHVAEFRESVDGHVAFLATKRATVKDIQRLKELLAQAKNLLEQQDVDWEGFMRVDIQLHVAIAEAARNPIFTAVLHMVHENVLGYYERFSFKDKSLLRQNYRDLCAMVEAIEQGKAEEATSLSQDHVRRFCRYLKKKQREARHHSLRG